ncbi:MAG: NADH:flavin oxidoreductase/NADH oxidase [Gemmatimonadota bacterium]|jgi:2,4-dienoyl-CoA reductase-like NADH-dependent reductase (Old Yellow Enzyme family)|nr:NADH:flavin oxidoreductase/NADH oxidase [Gemmatimonadota bacterium]
MDTAALATTAERETAIHLFTPLEIRGVRLRNRIVVSPMCQYSSQDGLANDWHLVHLGTRAVGGAGAVIAEATAVTPEGRISPGDLGLWNDEQIEPLARIFGFLESQGSVAGIQLAHAGRKAAVAAPFHGGRPLGIHEGAWTVAAPSPVPFGDGYQVPHALSLKDIKGIVAAFGAAARRARDAGARILEIHAAHGYLLHQFLSPLANKREDTYGGSFEHRTRLLREVVEAVRRLWPEDLPLFVRVSATDWVEGGWTVEDSVALALQLQPLGVDLMDCSSGGIIPKVTVPVGPGYQVPLAERVRRKSGLLTGAVGLISEPTQADQIIRSGQADLVLLGRELLRNPYWPIEASRQLGWTVPPPPQYARAF